MPRLAVVPVLCLALVLAAKSQGAPETFNLTYTGNGNGAVGTGTITIDPSVIPPFYPQITTLTGEISQAPKAWVTAFSVTISNATTAAGDGTFGFSDFNSKPGDIFIDLTAPVDFSKQLVGQAGLTDFNTFSNGTNAHAPSASGALTVNDGSGDSLSLISIAPVPEPATLSLLGLGALAFLRRSRRSR